MDKCSLPSLFAAFHVLHRLQVPRHSPHALSSLTIKLVHQQIFLCFCLSSVSRASPIGLGWSVFARRYSRNHCCFLFLQVLRWFTSLGWLVLPYEFRQSYIGFPHSDIDGSMDKCSSPSLFAAFHVLHRLKVPRHSPHALSSLTIKLVHQQIFLCFCLSSVSRASPINDRSHK